MKKNSQLLTAILLTSVFCLLSSVCPAQRIGVPDTLVSSNVAASATAAITNGIDCSTSTKVDLQLELTGGSAVATNAVVINLEKSLDGSGFVSAGTITATATGVTLTRSISQVTVSGARTLRTVSVDNSANATNVIVTLKGAVKSGL